MRNALIYLQNPAEGTKLKPGRRKKETVGAKQIAKDTPLENQAL